MYYIKKKSETCAKVTELVHKYNTMVNASIGSSIYGLNTHMAEVFKGEFNWEQSRLESRRPLGGEYMWHTGVYTKVSYGTHHGCMTVIGLMPKNFR